MLVLPDGTALMVPNANEAMFVYREVFENRCYVRHGLRIEAGACVVDTGAHAGLFSLFALREAPGVFVHAIEPSRELCRCLEANLRPFDGRVTIHPVAAGASSGEDTFTYYPKYTILSGLHADRKRDAEILLTGIKNQDRTTAGLGSGLDARALQFLVSRLLTETRQERCTVSTLSDIFDRERLERIDFLKIDAERSEWEILQGIAGHHWEAVRQIAMEIHDEEGSTLENIRELLAQKGFRVVIEKDEQFSGVGVFGLYALRSQTGRVPVQVNGIPAGRQCSLS